MRPSARSCCHVAGLAALEAPLGALAAEPVVLAVGLGLLAACEAVSGA